MTGAIAGNWGENSVRTEASEKLKVFKKSSYHFLWKKINLSKQCIKYLWIGNDSYLYFKSYFYVSAVHFSS